MYLVTEYYRDYEYHNNTVIANMATKHDADLLANMLNSKEQDKYDGEQDSWYSVSKLEAPTTLEEHLVQNPNHRFEWYPGEEESAKHFTDFQWECYDPMNEDIFWTNGKHYGDSVLEINSEYKYWFSSYYTNGYPEEVPTCVMEPAYTDEYL